MRQCRVRLTLCAALLVSFANATSAEWVQMGPWGGQVQAFAVSGSTIVAGASNDGAFLSTNNGQGWIDDNSGISPNSEIQAFAVNGSSIFAGTNGGGLFLSTDNGKSWSIDSSGLTPGSNITSLAANGSSIFAGTFFNGIFRSTNGTSWTSTGMIDRGATSFAMIGDTVFVGTILGPFTGKMIANVLFDPSFTMYTGGVFMSPDNGATWVAAGLENIDIKALLSRGNNIFAATESGIFLSDNNGASWKSTNSGLTDSLHVTCFSADQSTIFAGTSDGGVFLSTDTGKSWTVVNSGLSNTNVQSIVTSDSGVFAVTTEGSFRCSKGDTNWIALKSDQTNMWATCFAVEGNNVFAGTGDSGVFLSTNDGRSWVPVNSGLPDHEVLSLAAIGDDIFVGFQGGSVYRSPDTGKSWTEIDSGLSEDGVSFLEVSGNNIFAGTGSHGIFLSRNNGTSWTHVDSGLGIGALTVSGNNIFAGNYGGGVHLSTDTGKSWTSVNSGLTNLDVFALAASGNDIFAGTLGGIFLSTDNGTSWTAVNSGLANLYVQSLAVSDNELYVGTSNGGIWRKPISEITEMRGRSQRQGLIKQLTLQIHSPSFANHNMTIGFSLPHSDQVTVKIYNLSGREITSLVNKYLGAGSYSFNWDTKNVATSCYVVRMQADNDLQVRQFSLFR